MMFRIEIMCQARWRESVARTHQWYYNGAYMEEYQCFHMKEYLPAGAFAAVPLIQTVKYFQDFGWYTVEWYRRQIIMKCAWRLEPKPRRHDFIGAAFEWDWKPNCDGLPIGRIGFACEYEGVYREF